MLKDCKLVYSLFILFISSKTATSGTCSGSVFAPKYPCSNAEKSKKWHYDEYTKCTYSQEGCAGSRYRFNTFEECYETCYTENTTVPKLSDELTNHYVYDEGMCNSNSSQMGHSGGHVVVYSSASVALSPEPWLSRTPRCVVTFHAMPRHQGREQHLLISFDNIACHAPWIVYAHEDSDLESFVQLWPVGGSTQHFRRQDKSSFKTVPEYISSTPTLRVTYGSNRDQNCTGFRMTATVVREPFFNGSCGLLEFQCAETGLCIDEHLQCNGQYNCGIYDDSDELNCVRLPDHTGYQEKTEERQGMGIIMGTSLCTLLILTITLWITTVFIRRMRMKRQFMRMHREIIAHGQGTSLAARRGGPDYIQQITIPIHHGNPNVSLMEPPPCYSHESGSATFEMPPPYTPEACDTAGLLSQTQGLSSETPPAYHTVAPSFDSRETCSTARSPLLHASELRSTSRAENDVTDSGTVHPAPPYGEHSVDVRSHQRNGLVHNTESCQANAQLLSDNTPCDLSLTVGTNEIAPHKNVG